MLVRRSVLYAVFCCAVLYVILQLLLAQISGAAAGELGGPDSYMRVNRIISLLNNGEWFNPVYPRIYPPIGHEQHWTRPMDMAILLPAFMMKPFMEFGTAIHLSAMWVNLFLCVGALFAVYKTAERYSGSNQAIATLCIFILVLQTGMNTTFQFSRSDHQSILFLCAAGFICGLLPLLRGSNKSYSYIVAGFFAALGLWVSIEFSLVLAVAMATLMVMWLLSPKHLTSAIVKLFFILLALLGLFLVVERGPLAITSFSKDQISLVYVYLFSVLALGWFVIYLLTHHSKLCSTIAGRFVCGVCVAAVALLAATLIDTGITTGPLDNVNELYGITRLAFIDEYQSIFYEAFRDDRSIYSNIDSVLSYLGVPLVSAIYLVYRLLSGDRSYETLLFLFGVIVFFGMTVWQLHWASYALLFSIVPYSVLGYKLINKANDIQIAVLASASRIMLLILVCAWSFLSSVAGSVAGVQGNASQDENISLFTRSQCDLSAISEFLMEQYPNNKLNIIALADAGPELLYRTHHSVYSIPNHRFQPGYNQSFKLLSESNPDSALSIASEMNADLIQLCVGALESNHYKRIGAENTMYDQLAFENKVPDWLEEITLPASLNKNFKLFSVVAK